MIQLCEHASIISTEELPLPATAAKGPKEPMAVAAALKVPKEPLSVRRRLAKPPKTPKTPRAKTKSESETKTPDITDYLGQMLAYC